MEVNAVSDKELCIAGGVFAKGTAADERPEQTAITKSRMEESLRIRAATCLAMATALNSAVVAADSMPITISCSTPPRLFRKYRFCLMFLICNPSHTAEKMSRLFSCLHLQIANTRASGMISRRACNTPHAVLSFDTCFFCYCTCFFGTLGVVFFVLAFACPKALALRSFCGFFLSFLFACSQPRSLTPLTTQCNAHFHNHIRPSHHRDSLSWTARKDWHLLFHRVLHRGPERASAERQDVR